MLQSIGRRNDITDVDLSFQGSGDSGIDHRFYLKIIHQDLCADSCIYLTDSGTYYDNFFSV